MPRRGRLGVSHRYTLWRVLAQPSGRGDVLEEVALTKGEHGEMVARTRQVDWRDPANAEIAAHNAVEFSRATEEEARWRMRLQTSPLGKTQQDFVLYYGEVLRFFRSWANTLPDKA